MQQVHSKYPLQSTDHITIHSTTKLIVIAMKIYVHFKRKIFEYLTAGELGCKPIARFHIKNIGGEMDIYVI
jgi:hypothetical protein